MFLIEEIGIEVLMIAAVVVAVACLAHLLRLSLREHLYLRRLREDRRDSMFWLARTPPPTPPASLPPRPNPQPRLFRDS